jgi:hypothetical protein
MNDRRFFKERLFLYRTGILAILLLALMGMSCNQVYNSEQGTVTVVLGNQGRAVYTDTWPKDEEINLVFTEVILTVKDANRKTITEGKITGSGRPYTLEVPSGSNYRLEFEGTIDREKTTPETFAQSYAGLSGVFSVESDFNTSVDVQLVVQDRDIFYLKQETSGQWGFRTGSVPNFESWSNVVKSKPVPNNLPFRFDLDGPGRIVYKNNANKIQLLPEEGEGYEDIIISSSAYISGEAPEAIAWDPYEKAMYSLCYQVSANSLFKNDFSSETDTAIKISLGEGLTVPANLDTDGASAALDIDLEGAVYLTVVADGKLTIVKGRVDGTTFIRDTTFSLDHDLFEANDRITDTKVIRGKLYILVLKQTDGTPKGGEFIIANAQTGDILKNGIGVYNKENLTDPASSDSPVKPFYNPGFFAGWSGDKLYVYDFAPKVKYARTGTGTAASDDWSGRIVEIDISDPYEPSMTRNKVLGF